MSKPQFVSDITDTKLDWKWRVVRASIGTTTGLIVMTILGKAPRIGPQLGMTCDIQADGMVYTQLSQSGRGHRWAPLGSIENVRDNLRRVADTAKLDDMCRELFFEEFRKWVRKDYRAKSEN